MLMQNTNGTQQAGKVTLKSLMTEFNPMLNMLFMHGTDNYMKTWNFEGSVFLQF